MKAAQDNAITRKNGIVLIDPVKAKGQKQIVSACPYRLIEWNEELQTPQKCTFCAHLLDQGEKEPRCVESCPTGARVFGDLDDPTSAVSKLIASGKTEVMHPEFGLKEQVRYISLPRKFVSGTVVYGDKNEVAVGLKVLLKEDNGEMREAITNGFGDFEFDGLADNTNYQVIVEASGYKPATLTTKTQKDIHLGEIVLQK
jgi:ferredoxin